MILHDQRIRELCLEQNPPLITPFTDECPDGTISYGLTSAGYDLRLARDGILCYKNSHGLVIDPKRFKDEGYRRKMFDPISPLEDENGCEYVVMPPHSYFLVSSFEWMNVPSHLKGHCLGKSTYARSTLVVNTTPLEPAWSGHLTIELSNTSSLPIKLYVMEGIAQLEFHELTGLPKKDYAAKKGIYQNQTTTTPSRVRDVSEKELEPRG